VEVTVVVEGYGYPHRLTFTNLSTTNVYEANMTSGSIGSETGKFIFNNIPAGQYKATIIYHQPGKPLTNGNSDSTDYIAIITVASGYNLLELSQSPAPFDRPIGP
jgi:hypothetical protein